MNDVMERIRRQARSRPMRLLLPEGEDVRVRVAAARLHAAALARVTVVGNPERMHDALARSGASPADVETTSADDPAEIERTARALSSARGDRLDAGECQRLARDPLFQVACRVAEDRADCFVAGATHTTADVLRAALWLIGTERGVSTVSSFFLMVVPGASGGERALLFADCGVVPDPTVEQLAEIAVLASEHYTRLTGEPSYAAFLSFSTHGSARHPRVERVRAACERARTLRPDLAFDGELQADAALDPEVAARKAHGSGVAGRANVLVFPDLDSGNIGYKLVQRLGGARAYGPILMGLARQANDLSRGCSAEDVVEVCTIACALAASREGHTV